MQGGKRPYHTIIPAMALRGDDLFLSYGVMGGYMQVNKRCQVSRNSPLIIILHSLKDMFKCF